jgi:hypothetical protein
LPGMPATHRFAIPASHDLENIVDTTADFAPESQKCRFLLLRSVNHNRKGLQ